MTPDAYYELKAALALFGRDCSALTDDERVRAKNVARQYASIETVVLSSDEASGVCLSPGAVKKALGELRDRHQDAESFAATLAHAGLTESLLADALRRDLLVDAVMAKVGAAAGQVGATEAEIFYYTHLDRFHTPERRTARHILITVNENFPENTSERAAQRLSEIAGRLKAKPGRFEEQAIKHSECPTALNGGQLGEIRRGQLYPELDEALFHLAAGQLSDVLRSEMGFHIVRCDAIHPEGTVPYPEVAETLRQRLTEERASKDAKRWLAGLLKKTRTPAAG